MTVYKKIPTTIKILYSHSEYNSDYGWPLLRIKWNNNIVANIEANNSAIEFTINNVLKNNKLTFEHYGKNHINDNSKFVEIKKIYFNNVDLDNILLQGKYYPILPPWEKQISKPIIENTYMAWNGTLVYTFKDPLMLDIQKRLGRTVQQIEGQETTRQTLDKMKEYFFT